MDIKSSFTENEIKIIDILVARLNGLPLNSNEFLTEKFFNNQSGRALILNSRKRMGYLYLRASMSRSIEQLSSAIKSTLDLFLLLHRLKTDRILYSIAGAVEIEYSFIGTVFSNPIKSSSGWIINEEGWYSLDPSTILSQDGELMYEGFKIDGPAFEAIFSMCNSYLYIPEKNLSLLCSSITSIKDTKTRPERPEAENAMVKNKVSNWRIYLILLLLALAIFEYMHYRYG